jgi:anti-sigma factor RsiW
MMEDIRERRAREQAQAAQVAKHDASEAQRRERIRERARKEVQQIVSKVRSKIRADRKKREQALASHVSRFQARLEARAGGESMASGDVIGRWKSLVREAKQTHRDPGEAVRAVCRANPGLRERYIAAVNRRSPR